MTKTEKNALAVHDNLVPHSFPGGSASKKVPDGHQRSVTQNEIAVGASNSGRGHQGDDSHKDIAPSLSPPDGHSQAATQADRAAGGDLISSLMELQSMRQGVLRAQIRLKNQARAFVRRSLGWRYDLPEKELSAIRSKAESMVDAIEDGQTSNCAAGVSAMVLTLAESRRPLDPLRKTVEKNMDEKAKSLPAPVVDFVEVTKGFGYGSLAAIVGETGDIGSYSNPAKLWKRMGLAVFDGKAQRRTTDAELAIEMGFNPRRRSVIWNVGDSLIKSGGKYKLIYDQRKTFEHGKNPEMSKLHAHRRAKRFMEKRLLLDLWRCWHGKTAVGQLISDTHSKGAPAV